MFAERQRRTVEVARCKRPPLNADAARLGQPLDLVHEPTRGDGRVVGERLVSGVDGLEHGLGASLGRTVVENTARRG